MIVAMRLLILGGTVFVGRAIVEEALGRGHEITLFHRGQRGADLFADRVERVLGDRSQELSALEGRSLDAVVDTCGYLPRVVRKSARALQGAAPLYCFISSISVYDHPEPGSAEDAAVVPIRDPGNETVDEDSYAYLKVLCEREVEAAFSDRAVIVRPGLVVGPNDPTDRFTYWPVCMARGGEVLVPDADQPVQFVDARDLAAFVVGLLERGSGGVFHAAGPNPPHRLRDVLERCRELCGPEARLRWAPAQFLAELGVVPWRELPLYVGPDASESGSMALDPSRAVAAGLRFRPLDETIRDTLEWVRAIGKSDPSKAGLSAEREAELLHSLTAQGAPLT